ncbi:hypothetical protein [Micromonospora chersina]|uniref:hypothetical protein n=1 Tax=Micromonospora chersina TaxID=47854 RepID=UPI0037135DF8
MLAATRTLLASLDPLPYPKRMNHLAEWARTAPDRAQVCADLRQHSPYERHLALVGAMVAQDADGIAGAARDPQPSIRAAALTAALRAGILTGDLADRPATDRRRVYRALRRRHAPFVADALIIEVRAQFGDEEAAALLPACGAETIRALLPDLEHALTLERLVRWHTGPLLDRVRERLAAATPELRGESGAVPPVRCCGVTRLRRSTCSNGTHPRSRCPVRWSPTRCLRHTTRVASPACSPRRAERPG